MQTLAIDMTNIADRRVLLVQSRQVRSSLAGCAAKRHLQFENTRRLTRQSGRHKTAVGPNWF